MKAASKTKAILILALLLATMLAPGSHASRVTADVSGVRGTANDEALLNESGIRDFSTLGNYITECPQAGLPNNRSDPHGQDASYNGQPRPLDQRQVDAIEQASQQSRNVRVNQDYSCFPQDETSLSINPCSGAGSGHDASNSPCLNRNNRDDRRNTRCAGRSGAGDAQNGALFDCNLNLVGGANDYRQGVGASGFYASTDGGRHFYDGILPGPTTPKGAFNSGGDPALVHDRAGIVYYAELAFSSADGSNGVFVSRSTNGGFTWTRPCAPIQPQSPIPGKPDASRCGSVGDPRQPGDGAVIFTPDNGTGAAFNDKEYIAAGPRPAGVTPVCFSPVTRTPAPCTAAVVGVDRLYVTWTLFAADNSASTINVSYSDDQARSWSPPRVISGSAPFCTGAAGGGDACSDNQFSTPTVNPVTGALYVAFENFDTPNENQYLLVRSRDGGNTFEGPFFVTPVFDVNYPRAGVTRPDCAARGQQRGRAVLTNSCFRVNSGGNVVVDRRGGAFANNLYLVMSDNRNGTPASSNTDVFLFKSTDGGTTWIGPTRVNNDPSARPSTVSRNCTLPRPAPAPPRPTDDPNCAGSFGNDQWFPWVDISDNGVLNVGFFDRRLDTSSTASEHPESRQRPGNYLTWFWGATCRVTTTSPVPATGTTVPSEAAQCVAPEATVTRQPTAPIDPGTGVQPGGSQSAFPFRNVVVSDIPSNMDYAFREGLFIGDYNNVATPHRNVDQSGVQSSDARAVGPGDAAYGFWTDARNGRGSGNPTSPDPSAFQPGRNPACEQSDVFLDVFPSNVTGDKNDNDDTGRAGANNAQFLVAACPAAAIDRASQGNQGNQNGQGSQNGQGQ